MYYIAISSDPQWKSTVGVDDILKVTDISTNDSSTWAPLVARFDNGLEYFSFIYRQEGDNIIVPSTRYGSPSDDRLVLVKMSEEEIFRAKLSGKIQ